MEDKRFYLQMIQTTIERMASNSFKIKGWSLTAFGGLFTLIIANQDKRWSYNLLWLVLICALLFWWHDSYYLKLEIQYRKLYKRVARKNFKNVDFSMDLPKLSQNIFSIALRPILSMSYGVVVLISMILLYVFK